MLNFVLLVCITHTCQGLVSCVRFFVGKLTVQDEKWIQIVFDSPSLKLWPADFQYGGQSTVRIAVTYVDETIRLGRGSRGSLFVFRRKT